MITKKSQAIKIINKIEYRPILDSLPILFYNSLKNTGVSIDFDIECIHKLFAHFLEPNVFEKSLNELLRPFNIKLVISGTVEDRIAFIMADRSQSFIFSFGRNLVHLFDKVMIESLEISDINSYFSKAVFDDVFLEEINDMTIMLTSLYHPEVFPLPRFPLGISDLAYSIRKNHLGKVKLFDMQFGNSVDDICNIIMESKPKLVGFSATFGQNDILEIFISKLKKLSIDYSPTILFGGSLCALNVDNILQSLPNSFIGLGPGEQTIIDVVKFIKGKIPREEICGVAFMDMKQNIYKTENINNRAAYDILPDLDLLPTTLKHSGIMQLESSRGCSYSCSFCPRSHKGIWSGEASNSISGLLPYINNEFNKNPEIARKIFLVDEEFFGYHSLSDQRVTELSKELLNYGFKFETSSRIDQVFRPQKNHEWHINRLNTWKLLLRNMNRCLFGVESGVDTILKRFNKKTTSKQNVTAIRILSLLGVPIRYTYIIFDPLMDFDELVQNFQFISRTDLILKKNDQLSPSDIIDLSLEDKRSREVCSDTPFYKNISYMLVSMECLTGSDYTKMAEVAGLLENNNFQMGRVNTRYKDYRIGLFSYHSQLWIDRNFSLDYILKSLQKISDSCTYTKINQMRVRLKDFSYQLLGEMISLERSIDVYNKHQIVDGLYFSYLKNCWKTQDHAGKSEVLVKILDIYFNILKSEISNDFNSLSELLPEDSLRLLQDEVLLWQKSNRWRLINE
ncbi:B12-binding domain-containing radical SAM protein [Klebsiella variicola]|uniref:B12-binding domain-containing radical SAM protein n=1 Tax=Klebsiella variicola TaxID=244366 RepID=UPI0010335441|nr:radical SAM protein [Klebsiella variicola]